MKSVYPYHFAEDNYNTVNEDATLDLLPQVDKVFHPVVFEVMNAEIVGEGRARHVVGKDICNPL